MSLITIYEALAYDMLHSRVLCRYFSHKEKLYRKKGMIAETSFVFWMHHIFKRRLAVVEVLLLEFDDRPLEYGRHFSAGVAYRWNAMQERVCAYARRFGYDWVRWMM